MKKYITPTCDEISVASGEFMGQSSLRIFTTPTTGDTEDWTVTDGSQVLVNHNKLWETEEEYNWGL